MTYTIQVRTLDCFSFACVRPLVSHQKTSFAVVLLCLEYKPYLTHNNARVVIFKAYINDILLL